MNPAPPKPGWRRRILVTAGLMPLGVGLIGGLLSLASEPGWFIYLPLTIAAACAALLTERWKELSALERSAPQHNDTLAEDDAA